MKERRIHKASAFQRQPSMKIESRTNSHYIHSRQNIRRRILFYAIQNKCSRWWSFHKSNHWNDNFFCLPILNICHDAIVDNIERMITIFYFSDRWLLTIRIVTLNVWAIIMNDCVWSQKRESNWKLYWFDFGSTRNRHIFDVGYSLSVSNHSIHLRKCQASVCVCV